MIVRRRIRRSQWYLFSLFLLLPYLMLNSALGAESERGVLEIRIKDHREAIGDFSKFEIALNKILISPRPGFKFWQTGWRELTFSEVNVDLTQYTGKKNARVFRGSVPAGLFDGFDLKIAKVTAVQRKTGRTTPIKNRVAAVKLPFEIPSKGETVLIVDLAVTDVSDHPPQGYELGIVGYELYENNKLIEKIPPG